MNVDSALRVSLRPTNTPVVPSRRVSMLVPERCMPMMMMGSLCGMSVGAWGLAIEMGHLGRTPLEPGRGPGSPASNGVERECTIRAFWPRENPGPMIISHSSRFIFIKTRKTAGSSLEIALSRFCDPGDVITPLGESLGEESLRAAEGGQPPVNWEKPWWRYRTLREIRRRIKYGRRAARFTPHATVREVRKFVGKVTWDSYLSLSIERNPWDRALSRYWWQKYRMEKRGRSIPELGEYLRWLEQSKPEWLSNWGHYAVGDRVAVDLIIFYEDLAAGLRGITDALHLPEPLTMPGKHAKSGFRQDRGHYTEVLGERERRLVDRVCAREIELFGYRFCPDEGGPQGVFDARGS